MFESDLKFANPLNIRAAFSPVDSRQSQKDIGYFMLLDQFRQMPAPEHLISVQPLAVQPPIVINIAAQSHGGL